MTFTQAAPVLSHPRNRVAHAGLGRTAVGGFFLVMGGVHLGLVSADPQVYQHFADDALFDFVSTGWREIVMAARALYGLLLMAGEVTAGALLVTLARRDLRSARVPS